MQVSDTVAAKAKFTTIGDLEKAKAENARIKEIEEALRGDENPQYFDNPDSFKVRINAVKMAKAQGREHDSIVETTQEVINLIFGPSKAPYFIYEGVYVCRYGEAEKASVAIAGVDANELNHPKTFAQVQVK